MESIVSYSLKGCGGQIEHRLVEVQGFVFTRQLAEIS